MKALIITGVFLVNQLAAAPLQSEAEDQSGHTQEAPLFLHLLAPRSYNPPVSAQRIVTARVYPFRNFSISVGDLESPFSKPWDGASTNPIWSTNGPPKARPLEPLWDSGDATLAGRIEEVNGSFLAHLQGRNRSTVNYFIGKIELERPFFEQGSYYHDGAVWGVCFALSTNTDCSTFLKALEDGTLRRPNVVDRNSPLVEQWVKSKPSAEPGGAANRSQPVSPRTNRTSEAAGSGR